MSLGNFQKSSEVAVTFSEIPVVMRQKYHAFDSKKVGKYKIYMFPCTCILYVLEGIWNRSLCFSQKLMVMINLVVTGLCVIHYSL